MNNLKRRRQFTLVDISGARHMAIFNLIRIPSR